MSGQNCNITLRLDPNGWYPHLDNTTGQFLETVMLYGGQSLQQTNARSDTLKAFILPS